MSKHAVTISGGLQIKPTSSGFCCLIGMKHRQRIPSGTLLRPWERMQLDGLPHKREAPARVIIHEQVLSLLDKGKMPLDIADFLGLSQTTPYRIGKKYREKGL